ncbi:MULTISPECIES: hypothetical protein [Streptomyces]|uniref:ATP-binding protein n=1 Tax=Streptomyces koelreuteriae TaxID=2838015 RepID=A0ABX8FQT3_9ACTN|nr:MULTISPECIES: hypothetical protein [Streptomyces]QWB23415.1 hypothetical protein KJK29_12820 [Streptomyces koelreuteriae]UUA06369.1 hypothetical protein NNW98_12880 [Streptomyces koelreuteriae]UUA13998.1 hypothetical protein NNW99_12880 [Streptomyces sp. CRCS-T-1]
MARHVSPKKPTVQRALAVLATAGVALGAGAGAASAAAGAGSVLDMAHTSLGKTDLRSGLQAAGDTLAYTTGTVTGLKPNPLSGTGVDPLDNSVGTEVADFKPMTSREVTGPVAQAPSVGGLPVVEQAAGALSR